MAARRRPGDGNRAGRGHRCPRRGAVLVSYCSSRAVTRSAISACPPPSPRGSRRPRGPSPRVQGSRARSAVPAAFRHRGLGGRLLALVRACSVVSAAFCFVASFVSVTFCFAPRGLGLSLLLDVGLLGHRRNRVAELLPGLLDLLLDLLGIACASRLLWSCPPSGPCLLRAALGSLDVFPRALDRALRYRRRSGLDTTSSDERQDPRDRGVNEADDQSRKPRVHGLGQGEDRRGGHGPEGENADQAGCPEEARTEPEPLRLEATSRPWPARPPCEQAPLSDR